MRATSRTLVGPQHPTYQYAIRGKGAFIVTALDRAAGHGTLRFPRPGHYLVMERSATGAVVAEVRSEAKGTLVMLSPGTYFVRKRKPDLLLEGTVTISAGQVTRLNERALRRVAYAQLVRKGKGGRRVSHGPQLSYVIHGPILEGFGPLSQAEIGYPITFRHLRVTPRVAYGLLTKDAMDVSITHHELSLSLAAHYVFDVGRVSFFAGLSSGWGLAHQVFTSKLLAPSRTGQMFFFTGEGGVEVLLSPRWYVQVRAAAATYVVRRGLLADPKTATDVTYQLGAGVGWQLY